MEEHLREDKQELKTREQKRKAKDAKKIRGIAHENKGTSHVQDEKVNSCVTMSRNCSVCGNDGIGMTTMVGGLIRNCAPRRDVRRWSTFVATTCTPESESRAYGRREGAHQDLGGD